MWVATSVEQEQQLKLYLSSTNPFIKNLKTQSQDPKSLGASNNFPSLVTPSGKHSPSRLIFGSNLQESNKNKSTSKRRGIDTARVSFDEESSLLVSVSRDRTCYRSLSSFSSSSKKKLSSSSLSKSSSLSAASLELAQVIHESKTPNKTPNKQQVKTFEAIKTNEASNNKRDIEVIDLLFGGPERITYQASLVILAYVGLLAYTQVFTATILSQIYGVNPSPSEDMFLVNALIRAIFTIVVVPLSCADLDEQVRGE